MYRFHHLTKLYQALCCFGFILYVQQIHLKTNFVMMYSVITWTYICKTYLRVFSHWLLLSCLSSMVGIYEILE